MVKKKAVPKTKKETVIKVEEKAIPKVEEKPQSVQSKNQSSQSGA